LDTCRDQADAYDALRTFVILQFGKCKWASYLKLLRLPCTVENVKPSEVYAKLKRLLPFGADKNNEMFLAMFLMRLPPSIREQVGAADHTTIAAMVRHADRVWSFTGGQDQVDSPKGVNKNSKRPNGVIIAVFGMSCPATGI
jgi:hypothetical protein